MMPFPLYAASRLKIRPLPRIVVEFAATLLFTILSIGNAIAADKEWKPEVTWEPRSQTKLLKTDNGCTIYMFGSGLSEDPKVYNPHWTGECKNGLASGEGVLSYTIATSISSDHSLGYSHFERTGIAVKGKYSGLWLISEGDSSLSPEAAQAKLDCRIEISCVLEPIAYSANRMAYPAYKVLKAKFSPDFRNWPVVESWMKQVSLSLKKTPSISMERAKSLINAWRENEDSRFVTDGSPATSGTPAARSQDDPPVEGGSVSFE